MGYPNLDPFHCKNPASCTNHHHRHHPPKYLPFCHLKVMLAQKRKRKRWRTSSVNSGCRQLQTVSRTTSRNFERYESKCKPWQVGLNNARSLTLGREDWHCWSIPWRQGQKFSPAKLMATCLRWTWWWDPSLRNRFSWYHRVGWLLSKSLKAIHNFRTWILDMWMHP